MGNLIRDNAAPFPQSVRPATKRRQRFATATKRTISMASDLIGQCQRAETHSDVQCKDGTELMILHTGTTTWMCAWLEQADLDHFRSPSGEELLTSRFAEHIDWAMID